MNTHATTSATSWHTQPPINPVSQVNPDQTAPETFEAHGHTWTRHTPGNPCPVPAQTKVIVLLRRELLSPAARDEIRMAGLYAWGSFDGETWEIIGWRYATPPAATTSATSWHTQPPINPVSQVNPDQTAPETFEAHGHTWTRHTPGNPCPVPAQTKVIVLLRRELLSPAARDEIRMAGLYAWGSFDGETWEIIGWRYATPPTASPAAPPHSPASADDTPRLIYELVDATDEERYYPMGLFLNLATAMREAPAHHPGKWEPIMDTAAVAEIRARKVGTSGGDYTVLWRGHWHHDYEAGDWKLAETQTGTLEKPLPITRA